jgi:hypothetical protein
MNISSMTNEAQNKLIVHTKFLEEKHNYIGHVDCLLEF